MTADGQEGLQIDYEDIIIIIIKYSIILSIILSCQKKSSMPYLSYIYFSIWYVISPFGNNVYAMEWHHWVLQWCHSIAQLGNIALWINVA